MDAHELEIAHLRQDYQMATLSRRDVTPEPFAQFREWFSQARSAEILEPNAMILATVDAQGYPSTRTLLLKGADATGFTFFTNYQSAKGQDLEGNPHAAMTFLWKELQRQISIRGVVEKVTEAESDDYFKMRPYGSQIGALASVQSSIIPDRRWLEGRFADLSQTYPEGAVVPRPPHWGGFRLVPDAVEFWQGRASRLHDRLRYVRDAEQASGWRIERLSP